MTDFYQKKQKVDKQVNISEIQGDIGQAGDQVGGDKTTIGDIEGSAVAIGEGARASATTYIQEAPPPPPTPLQSLNVTSREYFTARQDEISWLLDALQPKRIVTLWGPGGIGKSAIVQAALEQLNADSQPPKRFPDGVIVHSFYGQPDTASFAAHIVRSLVGETAQDVTAAAAGRALGNKKLLLVLDGTEEAEDLGAVLRLCGDNGVLITTRNKGDTRSPKWRLAVERLPLDNAWTLLQKWDIEGLTESLGRQLCQFVDGWPLAIQIIGRYLDATNEPPQDYRAWLESAPIEALSFGQHREESIAILLSRSVKRLSDGARQIVGVVGLLAPAPIDRELVITSVALPNQETQRGIGELVRFGLLRRQGKQLEVGHALIHSYARRQPTPTQEVVLSLTSNIREKVNSLTPAPVLLFVWLPHLRAITDYTVEQAQDDEGATLCNSLGYALSLVADYSSAQNYFERALAIREKVLGPDHPDTAISLNNLGSLLQNQGDYEGARSYYERALAIREKVLGPDHPDTATSLNNLGILLQSQGDYEGARPYYERALAIREKAQGQNHPDTAVVLNNMGSLLQNQGDYEGAKPYYERALAIREKVLGPYHPDTAVVLNNLGSLLQNQGDYERARSYYERALTICEMALGPDHPDTAISLNNLGLLLQDQGDYEGARSYYERALDIREKVLGPDHPSTAASLSSLGGLLQAQGNYEEARLYFERALTICEMALDPDHPNTAKSLNNLGLLLKNQGDYERARSYYERALAIREKTLSPQHPGTANSLNNLGSLLQDQGDYEGARSYYERALDIREKVLGPDHPDTAKSLNNLGLLLKNQGDYERARSYYERALAIREKVLGPDHPSTANSLNNLGSLLQDQGDYERARSYYERALTICEMALGPDHPHTILVHNNLNS